MNTQGHRLRRWVVTGAIAAGAAVGAGGIAMAATNPSTSTTTPSADSQAPNGAQRNGSANPWNGQRPDPRNMPNGPGETVLTGDTAAKVKAAAEAAVPNATVIRVETDSEGSAYEAHMQTSDGQVVTVKLDANFNVTDKIQGFGPGGPGGMHPGPGGMPGSSNNNGSSNANGAGYGYGYGAPSGSGV